MLLGGHARPLGSILVDVGFVFELDVLQDH
jgi:hypothetical protein